MDDLNRNYSLEDIDRESIFHPNTSISEHLKKGPMIVSNARGVWINDQHGHDLIDCGAGLWCVNIGYGRPEMAEAAKKSVMDLAYHHIFGGTSNEPIIRLAEKVLQLLHVGNPDTSESDYLRVIERKTAVLFAAATRLGAMLAGASPTQQEQLAAFGMNLGDLLEMPGATSAVSVIRAFRPKIVYLYHLQNQNGT